MGWLLLLAAGLVEIAMAAALKRSEDWTRLWPVSYTHLTLPTKA